MRKKKGEKAKNNSSSRDESISIRYFEPKCYIFSGQHYLMVECFLRKFWRNFATANALRTLKPKIKLIMQINSIL